MEIPERPWAKVGADLFELNNQHYLLIVDYFSNWPEISKLDTLSAKNVISYMKSQISRYEIPDELISDNGTQFACAEFAQLMKDYDIKHTTSSPYHPQANGASRKNCTNCQTRIGEGERNLQSTTLLQKQSSRHWILSRSTVPGQIDDVADNIQTPTTRTLKLQGASQRNGLSPSEAEILLRQKCERKPVDISSRRSSHDEVRGHLEES